MLEYQFKRTNESTLFFILRPRIFSTNCGSRSIKKLDKNKIGDVFFFTKIKFSFDIRRSKQMECLHNSSEASGGDYKCREKKRMYLRINRAQDAYASYSIESRVKVIPRYVELPCERILLDSPYSSREKKRKTLPSQIFLSKTFNFVISSKLNFSKLNYLFWKRSNFHNKKKEERKKIEILSIKIFIKFRRMSPSR